MSLAPYVRILGRGPGRSRSLTREEARDAMHLILSGAAEPEAVGALLMLMRFRGEEAAEVAGFVDAVRARLFPWSMVGAAVDWPSYAAGRTRGHPYFLLAAKLVAQAGHPVLLHGWNAHQQGIASVCNALDGIDIPICCDAAQAGAMLDRHGIAYAPLETIDAALLGVLRLREKLGLRSIVNTVLRLLNPAAARVSVQGVFHPSYRILQNDVSALLGQPAQVIIKGGGGEFERHPSKPVTAHMLRDGVRSERVAAPFLCGTRRLHEDSALMPTVAALWHGERADPFAEAIVTGTAALALTALDTATDLATAQTEATRLWATRTIAMPA